MNLVGKVELNTVELPNALEFTVTREGSWLASIFILIGTGWVVWIFWRTGSLWVRMMAGAATLATALSFLATWLQGKETKLRVTEEELISEGNLDRLFTTSFRIATADISSLRFDNGGDGGPFGLYVKSGWRLTCVLPGLSREQVQTIIEAIQRKFPQIPTEDRRGSFLLWDDGPLTQLGLSDRDRKDPDAKA